MSSCNLFQVNEQTPISDIIDYLINGVSSTEDGIIFMQNLYETQPAISNKTLCEFFNVACYELPATKARAYSCGFLFQRTLHN